MPITLEKSGVTTMTRKDAERIANLLFMLEHAEAREREAHARCALFDGEPEWVLEDYRIEHECRKCDVRSARADLDAELAKWRKAQ